MSVQLISDYFSIVLFIYLLAKNKNILKQYSTISLF